ncbi:MAG: hypothetical protein AAGA75_28270 [Cyanobacteria bacterium P01_E01_bin.6]
METKTQPFVDIEYRKTTSSNIHLEDLLNGRISDIFRYEMGNILLNIADLNNVADSERKISIALEIKPNENRDIADIKVNVSSSCNSHSKCWKTSFLIGETARTIEAVERYSPPRDAEGNPIEEPIESNEGVLCNIELGSIYSGAVSEAFDHALSEVLLNIVDVNNQALATRRITIKASIKPSFTRDYAALTVKVVSSSNGQTKPIETAMTIQRSADMVMATERAIPQQKSLFENRVSL